jgi:hypothetical protein
LSIEFVLRSQTGFDIPKTFPIGQLGKGHDPILIETGKALDAEVALITIDASTEVAHRHEVHDLGKYERP